jgi:protein gp37
MGAKTGINWTDSTWNPVTGCTPAGEGCAHCYAARLAKRLPAVHGGIEPIHNWIVPFSKVICHPERLAIPLHWRKPRAIMCPSMGDLFHEDVPDEFIDLVFTRIALCPQHTFVVLTKRVKRMSRFLSRSIARSVSWEDDADKAHPLVCHVDDDYQPEYTKNDERLIDQFELGLENIRAAERWTLPNVVLGASFSTQKEVDDGMGFLLNTPANRRIVSLEPLVGPVIIQPEHLSRLSGVIVGGESGPGARPMHPDWVRSLRDQCEAACVPFFFKQWGEWAHGSILRDSPGGIPLNLARLPHTPCAVGRFARIGLHRAGRLLDGRTHDDLCWDVAVKGEA